MIVHEEPRHVRVLLVEDDIDDAGRVRRGLRGAFDVAHVRTGADALDAVRRQAYDICLVDHRLPDGSGVEVCKKMRAASAQMRIIMVSSVQQGEVVRRALEAGADDFVTKDLDYGHRLPEVLQALVA